MSKIERIVETFRTERLYDSSHGYAMPKNLIVSVNKISQIRWINFGSFLISIFTH
ncbi:MAG: hypothetical protein ACR2LR_19090 [Hassallia sp.]